MWLSSSASLTRRPASPIGIESRNGVEGADADTAGDARPSDDAESVARNECDRSDPTGEAGPEPAMSARKSTGMALDQRADTGRRLRLGARPSTVSERGNRGLPGVSRKAAWVGGADDAPVRPPRADSPVVNETSGEETVTDSVGLGRDVARVRDALGRLGDGGTGGNACDDCAAGADWIVGVGGNGTPHAAMSGAAGSAGLGSREPLPKSLSRPLLFLFLSVGRLGAAGVAGGEGGKWSDGGGCSAALAAAAAAMRSRSRLRATSSGMSEKPGPATVGAGPDVTGALIRATTGLAGSAGTAGTFSPLMIVDAADLTDAATEFFRLSGVRDDVVPSMSRKGASDAASLDDLAKRERRGDGGASTPRPSPRSAPPASFVLVTERDRDRPVRLPPSPASNGSKSPPSIHGGVPWIVVLGPRYDGTRRSAAGGSLRIGSSSKSSTSIGPRDLVGSDRIGGGGTLSNVGDVGVAMDVSDALDTDAVEVELASAGVRIESDSDGIRTRGVATRVANWALWTMDGEYSDTLIPLRSSSNEASLTVRSGDHGSVTVAGEKAGSGCAWPRWTSICDTVEAAMRGERACSRNQTGS